MVVRFPAMGPAQRLVHVMRELKEAQAALAKAQERVRALQDEEKKSSKCGSSTAMLKGKPCPGGPSWSGVKYI
jgi:hypothetical protein